MQARDEHGALRGGGVGVEEQEVVVVVVEYVLPAGVFVGVGEGVLVEELAFVFDEAVAE